MKVFKEIPFELDVDQVLDEANSDPSMVDMNTMQKMVELASDAARPKAAFEVCYISGRDNGKVRLGEVWLESPVLAHNLKDLERVFAYVATCGEEVDRVAAQPEDLLEKYWWEMVKTVLLHSAHDYLVEHLQKVYRLADVTTMNPGSGDATIWPIQQQRQLFSLLGNVEDEVGVHLTDSCLMIPNKSLSGIIFPTESDFRNCQVCHRENCPSRCAPFNQQLWAEVHK